MNSIISVEGLTFRYPTNVALEDVSFSIPAGTITALVGPNGAGKSTLMRCLTGLETPFSGKINVCSINVLENQRQAHTKMGYLSDSFGLYDDLRVKDVLIYIGGCHGLTASNLNGRIEEVATLLRLENVLNQKCGTLSRGWRQRVGIAMSIIHKPEVLILDEPASGLDPESRHELSVILKTLQRTGMTILVSSHILTELEEYCTAMLVIREGKIQNHTDLQEHIGNNNTTIRIRLSEAPSQAQKDEALTILGNTYSPISWSNDELILTAPSNNATHHEILKQCLQLNLKICHFNVEEKKLQTLYLEIANAEGRVPNVQH